jgi:hypothetical protein
MATNRTIIFADGENLVLRYQELAKTRKVNPNVTHIPDAFIWHQNITSGWKWLDVIRVSYYTSIVGDDNKLDELRKKIASVQYEFKTEVRREQGRVCPHVFKRSSKSQKTKIVDVNLVIDVLRHTYI